MPSLTENFSYTVLESLQAGIPVLISDQTPWRDLEAQGIGWDLDLVTRQPWLDALQILIDRGLTENYAHHIRVHHYAKQWVANYAEAAQALFARAI